MKQGPIRLVVLNGAPQVSGTVAKLAKQAVAAAKHEARFHDFKVEAEVIHLNRVMKGFHQGRFDFPRWLRPTFASLNAADIVIFATPVTNYSASPLMHNMLAYLYSFERADGTHVLDGKVVGTVIHGREDCATKADLDMQGPFNDFGLHRPPHSRGIQIRGGKDRSENLWQLTEHLLTGENIVRTHIVINIDNAIDVNGWDIRYVPPNIKAEVERARASEIRH